MDIEPKRRGRPPGSVNAQSFADEAPVAQTAPATRVKVRVMRDFWDEKEQRVSSGTIIEVGVTEALRGVKSGALDPVED